MANADVARVQNRTREVVTLLAADGDTVKVPPGIHPIHPRFTVNLPPYVKKVDGIDWRRRNRRRRFETIEAPEASSQLPPAEKTAPEPSLTPESPPKAEEPSGSKRDRRK